MKVWRLLSFCEEDPFINMATDEAIFRESLRSETLPTLRFYGWRHPTVSLGYFQKAASEIDLDACRRHKVAVVRRPTGGRAVYHDEELTYSVVSGSAPPCFAPSVMGTYRAITICIARGLASVGLKTDLAEAVPVRENGFLSAYCFSEPSRYELLADGKKICGSAQMRSRGGFLQHGSLLLAFDPFKTLDLLLPHLDRKEQIADLRNSVTSVKDIMGSGLSRKDLLEAIIHGFRDVLGIEFVEGSLTLSEQAQRDRLLLEKYRTDRWNIEGRLNGHGL